MEYWNATSIEYKGFSLSLKDFLGNFRGGFKDCFHFLFSKDFPCDFIDRW